jgi:tRNA 2-thiouridine synthesizing protein A
MATSIDARGLSCPQPVILTRKALQESEGNEVVVLVDSVTQVYNCTRAAEKLGWRADCQQKPDTYELTFRQ